jgi:hypothetical protein
MRYRVVFAVGLAVGYVLGARAGRERYEQIKRVTQRVADNPKVQEAAGLLGAQASRVATAARDKVGDTLGDKVPFRHKNTTWHPEKVTTGSGWPDDADGTPT